MSQFDDSIPDTPLEALELLEDLIWEQTTWHNKLWRWLNDFLLGSDVYSWYCRERLLRVYRRVSPMYQHRQPELLGMRKRMLDALTKAADVLGNTEHIKP